VSERNGFRYSSNGDIGSRQRTQYLPLIFGPAPTVILHPISAVVPPFTGLKAEIIRHFDGNIALIVGFDKAMRLEDARILIDKCVFHVQPPLGTV
jgi:hypothetical protein